MQHFCGYTTIFLRNVHENMKKSSLSCKMAKNWKSISELELRHPVISTLCFSQLLHNLWFLPNSNFLILQQLFYNSKSHKFQWTKITFVCIFWQGWPVCIFLIRKYDQTIQIFHTSYTTTDLDSCSKV